MIIADFSHTRASPTRRLTDLKDKFPTPSKKRRVKKLYELQESVSREKLAKYKGGTVKVLCDGIDYDAGCFVGRAYFQAPDVDGKVYFNAYEANQGEYYEVLIEETDAYDMYGRTEDYDDERRV